VFGFAITLALIAGLFIAIASVAWPEN